MAQKAKKLDEQRLKMNKSAKLINVEGMDSVLEEIDEEE